MHTVNMHEAKTQLSKLVAQLESGAEDEITIARNGRPVARLVRMDEACDSRRRIGAAKGAFTLPEQTEELDRKVAELFVGSAAAEPAPGFKRRSGDGPDVDENSSR